MFTTLVVPAPATSSILLRSIARHLGRFMRRAVRRTDTYEAKDRLMAIVGPLGMVLLFVVWLVLLVVGFGFMTWWSSGSTLGHAMAISGSSVFTLGVASGSHPQTATLKFIAAGTGLLVIALEIAYLPTLYSAFSAREAEVSLLATRAGTPAWGPEVLARHHWFRIMGELPGLYGTWERWAAEVSESHTNYPSLMWFRSPVPSRSWLTTLTSMLGRGRAARRHLPSVSASAGADLSADGYELSAVAGTDLSDRPRCRSAPHCADPAQLRRVHPGLPASAQRGFPCGAPPRRGVATFLGVACQLRAHRGPADPHDHAPTGTLVPVRALSSEPSSCPGCSIAPPTTPRPRPILNDSATSLSG